MVLMGGRSVKIDPPELLGRAGTFIPALESVKPVRPMPKSPKLSGTDVVRFRKLAAALPYLAHL
jgi:hypothetical protein